MKRIQKILVIVLIVLTPLFWFGVKKLGEARVNKMYIEFRDERYAEEIKEYNDWYKEMEEEYISEGSISIVELMDEQKIRWDKILIKSSADFNREKGGVAKRYESTYPIVLSLIYLSILIFLLSKARKKI